MLLRTVYAVRMPLVVVDFRVVRETKRSISSIAPDDSTGVVNLVPR
jgi:hypothetical protein